jgi:hypothetical protein
MEIGCTSTLWTTFRILKSLRSRKFQPGSSPFPLPFGRRSVRNNRIQDHSPQFNHSPRLIRRIYIMYWPHECIAIHNSLRWFLNSACALIITIIACGSRKRARSFCIPWLMLSTTSVPAHELDQQHRLFPPAVRVRSFPSLDGDRKEFFYFCIFSRRSLKLSEGGSKLPWT